MIYMSWISDWLMLNISKLGEYDYFILIFVWLIIYKYWTPDYSTSAMNWTDKIDENFKLHSVWFIALLKL